MNAWSNKIFLKKKKDEYGWTALIHAIKYNKNTDIIKIFAEKWDDVNHKRIKKTTTY